jgi:Subtilase family
MTVMDQAAENIHTSDEPRRALGNGVTSRSFVTRPPAQSILRSVGLAQLRAITAGDPAVRIALIDGHVAEHESLSPASIIHLATSADVDPTTETVRHATFIASMLTGRGPEVLSLCPDSRILSIPVVDEAMIKGDTPPDKVAESLARAMMRAVAEAASVIHLSIELRTCERRFLDPLVDAVSFAARRKVRIIMPAGNTGNLSPSALLAAPGVLPVGMAGNATNPDPRSAWGPSIARRGLMAPGTDIPGALSPRGYTRRSGTSFAAAIVTGAFALLCSRAHGDSDEAWSALLEPTWRRMRVSNSIPPMLDAESGPFISGHRTSKGAV